MAKKKPAAKAKAVTASTTSKKTKPAKDTNPTADKSSPKADRTAAAAKAKATKLGKAKATEWLHKKAVELTKQRRKLRIAESAWESAHAAQGLAKKKMEEEQAILNSIVDDMEKIDSGNFTPPLFKEQELRAAKTAQSATSPTPTAEDVGGKKPLTTLIAKNLKAACPAKYRDGIGLSEKQIDKLEEIICGNTIGQLEKFQRENSFDWNRKMKGFGETGVDKLQDAMSVFRSTFPIPSPDDKSAPPTPAQSSANAAVASNGKPVDPLTKAFTDGQEACRGGHGFQTCPHPSGTPLALKWVEGHESEKSASNDKPALSEADKTKLRESQNKATTSKA